MVRLVGELHATSCLDRFNLGLWVPVDNVERGSHGHWGKCPYGKDVLSLFLFFSTPTHIQYMHMNVKVKQKIEGKHTFSHLSLSMVLQVPVTHYNKFFLMVMDGLITLGMGSGHDENRDGWEAKSVQAANNKVLKV